VTSHSLLGIMASASFNLRQACWRNGCGDGSPAGGQPAEISKARSGNAPTDVSAVFDELSGRLRGQPAKVLMEGVRER